MTSTLKATTQLNGWPVEVEIIKRNKKTVLVKLPDGHIIKRKWNQITP